MTAKGPTLEEQIEAVEWEIRGVQIGLASHVDPELAALHEARLKAAAATLRSLAAREQEQSQSDADLGKEAISAMSGLHRPVAASAPDSASDPSPAAEDGPCTYCGGVGCKACSALYSPAQAGVPTILESIDEVLQIVGDGEINGSDAEATLFYALQRAREEIAMRERQTMRQREEMIGALERIAALEKDLAAAGQERIAALKEAEEHLRMQGDFRAASEIDPTNPSSRFYAPSTERSNENDCKT